MSRWILFDLGNTLIRSPPYKYRRKEKICYLSNIFEQLTFRNLVRSCSLSRSEFAGKVLESKNDAVLLEETCMQVIREHSESVDTYLLEVLKELLNNAEAIDLTGYMLWPDELSILSSIQAAGYSLCLIANSSHPAKIRKILQDSKEGSASLLDFLSKVYITSELGLAKPDPALMNSILSDLSTTKDNVVVVGDSLDIDIFWAQQCGIKSVWLNLSPTHKHKNIEYINEKKVYYPRSIMSLNLLVETIQYYEPSGLRVGYFLPTSKKRILIAKVNIR